MYQIVFSESGAAELSRIEKLAQLEIVDELSKLRKENLEVESDQLGRLKKGNRTLHRFRYKDYRFYFEKKDRQLLVHHVLHKNTFSDFFYRSNLDIADDRKFEETEKFWNFIEQQTKQAEVKMGKAIG
jgi:mRNA-degrading endonuclease RelE of RelBE toxin-antitoxin system